MVGVGQLLYTCIEDAEGVLEELKSIRVTINLDDSKRRKALADIAKLADEFDDVYKPDVFNDVFYGILFELFKSVVVDAEMVEKVIEAHSINTISDDEEDEKYKFEVFAIDRVSERDEIDEVDWEMIEGVEEFRKYDKSDDFVPDAVRRAEVEAILKQYAEASIKVMEEQCRIMGCSLKQGQQSQIIDRLIQWILDRGLRFTRCCDMEGSIESFMNEVERYIARSCVLDDLETVTKAIQVARLDAQKFGYRKKNVKFDGCDMEVEDQLVEKITAPTNEEGIPVNQFKQEQRSSGVECEIFTPMKVERKQIFPTTPEQTEVCGNVVTPLKQDKEEEYIVNVDVCLTPECTSQPRKRKLEEISQPVVIS